MRKLLDIVDAVDYFREQPSTNVADYGRFYPKHPKKHYVQLGDYPSATERPNLRVPAVSTFDTESRYQTVIGFGTIGEQEYIEGQGTAIAEAVFTLRLMDIPYTMDKQYLGFLEIQGMTPACLETDDILKINFDLVARVESEDWGATVIDSMPSMQRNLHRYVSHCSRHKNRDEQSIVVLLFLFSRSPRPVHFSDQKITHIFC